ncbi:hypothetical protein OG585_19770 [Streptomyces sp. NBC_01340]|uniref:hypothetical protein n=1 Tax=Streptomyces sp. NBC_01340 TaxID=2903830 RepID=UPI002E15C1F4|nr:hypothetical protein OG585_19770 [Streptomyces sp. NBC_01340]
MAQATPADRHRGTVVPRDGGLGLLLQGALPVPAAPDAGVRRVNGDHDEAGVAGHAAQAFPEPGGGDARDRTAQLLPASASAHGLPPGGAGVGKAEVLDHEPGAALPLRDAQESGDRGSPEDSFETDFTVASGPDLSLTPMADVEHAQPGGTETIPFELINKGNESAHGVKVKMTASYGLDFLNKYDACTYTRSGGDDYAPMTDATCTFDQVLAPGDSFELPAPLELAIARHALNDRLDISVDPADGAIDLASRDNYAALQIGTDNTADFSVTGAAVAGTAGQTVTAPLTFKNNGPAWFANLGSGDPAAKVRLIVPTGTTVTGVPADCVPHTLTGGYYGQRTGAPRYDCALPYWVSESTERTYVFQLRIDAAVPGTTGEVSIHPEFGDFAFDPDTTNNTAVLAVN